MSEQIIIDTRDLTKQYKKQIVVNHANFQIKRGSICGLIGPNGAGKTTIMKMLGGLVIPSEGKMSIWGCSDATGLAKARERASFMIETPYANQDLTAYQNLEKQRLQKGIPDKSRIDEVLHMVGLTNIEKKKFKEFSLGMKQRFGLANALLTKPEIMVLDEPINGLDPEGIVEIRELLLKLNQQQNITIMISSHILSELSLMCDDYLFIAGGNIVKHLTREELSNECRNYLNIHTDNDELAIAVLQEKLQIQNFEVQKDGSITLYEYVDNVAPVSRTLFENGVLPLELSTGGENLEEYYMSIVGGVEDVERN